ncbi:MAG TPA: restriction endonuclease subunit S [Acidobacteriaceae bacterium]
MKWHTLPLKQLAEFDPPPPRKQLLETNQVVAFMPMASVIAENSVATTELERPSTEVLAGYTFFQKKDVLVAKITPCFENGKIAIADISHECGFGTTEFHVIRVESNLLDAKYLTHFLRQAWVIAEGGRKMTGSAGQRRVPRHFLEGLDIPTPTIEEQRRIAAILDQAEALRAKRRQALAKLDTLTQSLFLEMFGDPSTNPKKWHIRRLDELCLEISDIDHKMPLAVDEGLPFISAKDLLDDGTLSFENVKKISQEDFDRLARKSRPKRGDIIYSRIGVNLGKARLVEVDFDFLASYSCCTVRPNRELVNRRFLCTFLDSPFALTQAKKGVKAIAVPDLGLGEIKNFKVPVPTMDIQDEFARQIKSLSALRTMYRASASHVTKSFTALQHRAFRGEL